MRSTGSRLTVVYQPGPKSKPHRGFRAFYEGKMLNVEVVVAFFDIYQKVSGWIVVVTKTDF